MKKLTSLLSLLSLALIASCSSNISNSDLIPSDESGNNDSNTDNQQTLSPGIYRAIDGFPVLDTSVQPNDESFGLSFSTDGDQVVFSSLASNLVPNDNNAVWDVFVKNITTGIITRVSTDSTGAEANGTSYTMEAKFSPDGKKVVFESQATNLVSGINNGVYQIYVKNLEDGSIVCASTTAAGVQGGGNSQEARFSPDGTKVIFYSEASNLIAGDTNGVMDIFIKNLTDNSITRVSTDSSSAQADGDSFEPEYAPDGTKILFKSRATDLVDDDTNMAEDIFVKNLTSGIVTRISTDATGNESNGDSYNAHFSPDSTKVIFRSNASNLVDVDTNGGTEDLFLKNLNDETIIIVSTNSIGEQGNSDSYRGSFSSDGTKIIFDSDATNLVDDDTNGVSDIFIKDLTSGTVIRISKSKEGIEGNQASYGSNLSFDGEKATFYSGASNLVPNDTNNHGDVFFVKF